MPKNTQPSQVDPLREWAMAEGMAVRAEEMVRNTLANHLQHGTEMPTDEMQANARLLRERADALFAVIRQDQKK
jgi:sensor histidine kinase regulating citrate/malate metabolism